MHTRAHDSTPTPLPARIVLAGFMGAGKSTVGCLLAVRLGWDFVDLDDAIVQAEGQEIATLFAALGETVFREREHAALKRILPQSSLVLALGGGALESEANRKLLRDTPNTRIVFLEAPLATLLARCQQQQTQPNTAIRPVLANLENLSQRYMDRLPYYQAAHHTVSTKNLEPDEVVNAVLKTMQFP
jgi:shikimate kinase